MKKALLFFLFGVSLLSRAQNPIFQWSEKIGGNYFDQSHGVAYDASGNIYVVGNFQGGADFDPGPGVFYLSTFGNWDVFILKLDASGNFIWAKNMGGNGSIAEGLSVTTDNFGNVYTTGWCGGKMDFDPGPGTYTLGAIGFYDIFISKLDGNGNFIWAKRIGDSFNYSGYGGDRSNSIALDRSGNVYTVGWYTGITDFDPGPGIFNLTTIPANVNGFILKLDASGNFVWAKNINGPAENYGNCIIPDNLGNIFITGHFRDTADFDPGPGIFNLSTSTRYDADIFVLKLNSSGDFIWVKRFGGTGYDDGFGVTFDAKGNVYTTGTFEATVDFDPGLNLYNLSSLGPRDIFISKLDSGGNFRWAKNIGDTGAWDCGGSIALDAFANVYTTGSFGGTTDFDPGPGTFILTGNDIFISKLDSAGNFLWAGGMGNAINNTSYCGGASIKVDPNGNIYTVGGFIGTGDFDPGAGMYNLTSTSIDGFVHKMGLCVPLTASTSIQSVYCSNDANGSATITPSGTGAFTYSWMPGGGNTAIANGLSAGNYSCAITNSCAAVFMDTIQIIPLFNNPTITAISNRSLICSSESATLTAMGGVTYTWSSGGAYNSTVVSPTVTSTYTVTGMDMSGCTNTAVVFLAVNDCVGITEQSIHLVFRVYPNPTSSSINVQYAASEDCSSIDLYVNDVLGQRLYTKSRKGSRELNETIDLSHYPKGVYFVELLAPGNREVKRIIVE